MKVSRILFFSVLAGMVVMVSGCRSKKASADMYGSDPNMFGGPVIAGDMPLNPDNMGLPSDGDRSMFAPVYFAYDSSQVNPEEASKVEAVANYLKKKKGGGVIVEGHGDERGSREYNIALGQRRSDGVKKMMILLGVREDQVESVSLGEEKPRAQGSTEDAWAQNRRSDILYPGEY